MDMLRVQEWKWNIPFHFEAYFSQKKKGWGKQRLEIPTETEKEPLDITDVVAVMSQSWIWGPVTSWSKSQSGRLRLKKEFKLKVPPLTTGGVSPTTRQQGFGFCLDKSPDLKDLCVFSLSDHSCSSTVWWTEWKHNRRRVYEKHSWPCCQSEQNS